MVSTQLTKGLHAGTILWIKKLAQSEDGESHGLPHDYSMHPCVVLDLPASMKGFAQIYVITSRRGRNINDLPLSQKSRSHYVPIWPQPFNNILPGVQLRLAGDCELRKDSYVNTEKVFTLPLSKLELYDRKRSITDFRLDSASIRWLRQKAFGEELSGVQIKLNVATASTSTLPGSNKDTQPLHQYAAVRQYAAVPVYNARTQHAILPQHVAVPSQRAFTGLPTSYEPHDNNNKNNSIQTIVVATVAVLALVITAALLLFSIAL